MFISRVLTITVIAASLYFAITYNFDTPNINEGLKDCRAKATKLAAGMESLAADMGRRAYSSCANRLRRRFDDLKYAVESIDTCKLTDECLATYKDLYNDLHTCVFGDRE